MVSQLNLKCVASPRIATTVCKDFLVSHWSISLHLHIRSTEIPRCRLHRSAEQSQQIGVILVLFQASIQRLLSAYLSVCVCRGWQEEFVLLSGSLKSSSSLDLKPGLMTRLIHWHRCAALSLSEPLHTPAAKHTRDPPASPRECESLAHAGVLKVSCAWDCV